MSASLSFTSDLALIWAKGVVGVEGVVEAERVAGVEEVLRAEGVVGAEEVVGVEGVVGAELSEVIDNVDEVTGMEELTSLPAANRS